MAEIPQEYAFKGIETIPIAKTVFKQVSRSGNERIVDLSGKDFILVSVREIGSDGRFYAVDSDGTVWWSGPVTSGAPQFKSPSGIFPIIQKKRYHMSTVFPDPSGINNMNYINQLIIDLSSQINYIIDLIPTESFLDELLDLHRISV